MLCFIRLMSRVEMKIEYDALVVDRSFDDYFRDEASLKMWCFEGVYECKPSLCVKSTAV